MGKLGKFFFREEKKREVRFILSIDGGGMRGIIPAYMLSKLDGMLKKLGDERPLYSHFDLIAGTSTGALLALGLSIPADGTVREKEEADPFEVYEVKRKGLLKREEKIIKGYILPSASPSSLLDIYLKHGERIFPRSILNVFNQLFQVKYDIRPFESFLKEELEDLPLDSALVPTIAISYDCPNARPYIFKSFDSHGFLAREAARASTAAPLYFPPAKLMDRKSGEHLVLSDGGLVANNPAMLSYIEAKKLYPDADEYHILSLSTCKRPFSFDPSRTSGGATTWMMNITRIYSNAQVNLVSDEIEKMQDVSYTRIYSPILEKHIALDDTSKESISILLEGAERAFKNQEKEIEDYALDLFLHGTCSAVKLYPVYPTLISKDD